MSTKTMRRRQMIRGGLHAAALAPLAGFLPNLASARAQTPSAPRVLFVYVPDGCIPDRWHPTGTETNFSLPEMTAPLARVQQECVFIDGLTMYAGGATHEGGVRKVLTGAGDVSLDIFLEREVGKDTPFASLQLGVGSGFQNGSGVVSFSGPEIQVTPEDNPVAAFTRLFGGTGGDADDPAVALAKARSKSVLDASIADLNAIRARLGPLEKQRLEAHLDSLREIETRLIHGTGGDCTNANVDLGGFTVDPNDHYPKTFHKDEHFATVGRLQTDIMVAALGCQLTRVGTLMWSHPVSPSRVLPDISQGHHDVSHYGDANSPMAGQFVRLQAWFCERIAELIEKLRQTPDGDATLLDNCLVVLHSDIGDGNSHAHDRMPFVLAGGSAMGLRTGRFLDYRGKHGGEDEAHTKLLVSVAQAMGVEIDAFGYTGHGLGGLENLF